MAIRKQVQELSENKLHKYLIGNNAEKSSGNYLYNTKNTNFSYDCKEVEECKFSYNIMRKGAHIYDCDTAGFEGELLYESINT